MTAASTGTQSHGFRYATDGYTSDARSSSHPESGSLDATAVNYLTAYVDQFGHSYVPAGFVVDENGFPLGGWLISVRHRFRSLSAAARSTLDSLGVEPDENAAIWEEGLRHLRTYRKQNPQRLRPPEETATSTGFPLGAWFAQQRETHALGQQSHDHTRRLAWGALLHDDAMDWDAHVEAFVQFARTYRHTQVPEGYVDENGVALGEWAGALRASGPPSGRFGPYMRNRLHDLGIELQAEDQEDDAWEFAARQLVEYIERHGHAHVPEGFVTRGQYPLGRWLEQQRQRDVSDARWHRLSSLGVERNSGRASRMKDCYDWLHRDGLTGETVNADTRTVIYWSWQGVDLMLCVGPSSRQRLRDGDIPIMTLVHASTNRCIHHAMPNVGSRCGC